MGLQTNQCCCCGCLRGPTECCKCTCRRLCVTFIPTPGSLDAEYNECQTFSEEIDWDEVEEAFIGSVAGLDFRYYFEQDPNSPECYFKLRSTTLGFPEGSEAIWIIGESTGSDTSTTSCRFLDTSIEISTVYIEDDFCSSGTLTTSCAIKIKPTNCSGCGCACECLCVSYTNADGVFNAKICWDGIGQWTGEIEISAYETKSITVALFPKNLIADPYSEDYDPNDTTCVMVMSLDNDSDGTYILANCPDVTGTWNLITDYAPDEAITIRCAECSESCQPKVTVCCNGFPIPRTIFVTMDVYITVIDNFGGGAILIDHEYCLTITAPLTANEGLSQWDSGDIVMPGCVCGENDDPVTLRMSVFCAAVPTDTSSSFLFSVFYAPGVPCSASGTTGQSFLGTINCDPFILGVSYTSLLQNIIVSCCVPDFVNEGGDGQYAIVMNFDLLFTG